MIDKIQAFGDSFFYGSDLPDCDGSGTFEHSNLTWPALATKKLGLDYECWSLGGCGNGVISSNVIRLSSKNSLVLINWTWLDRFDYNDATGNPLTIRPGNDDEISKFYYKKIHSDIVDKFTTLSLIHSTHSYLKKQGIKFISTYMDTSLTKINPDWFLSCKILQEEILPELHSFPDKQTFLEWSRANGYPESEGWHPLEEAHEKAAEYWLPIYQQAINTHTATTKD